jgi:hypothetical protein
MIVTKQSLGVGAQVNLNALDTKMSMARGKKSALTGNSTLLLAIIYHFPTDESGFSFKGNIFLELLR